MKKLVVILTLITFSLMGMIFAVSAPVNAGGGDDEIEILRNMIKELEQKREAEVKELKKRINALEKKRAAAPSVQVEELKKTVGELKTKVAEQTSSFDRITGFMEKHKLKAGLRMQAWYQFVEDGKKGGTKDLHDDGSGQHLVPHRIRK